MIGIVKRRIIRTFARLPFGSECECPLCRSRVGSFCPLEGGWSGATPVLRALNVIGSDLDHYLCPVCACNDRERHLFLYLKGLGLMEKMRARAVLHFAPEGRVAAIINQLEPSLYVKADLFPSDPSVRKIDMLDIPFADNTFDFVIASHVLEHVSDDQKALSEVRRVLKPKGVAVLQTPYSEVLEKTFSDPGVQTEVARTVVYGQADHLRLYGRDIFERFSAAGFVCRAMSHEEALPEVDPKRYGVNKREPFFWFERS